MTHQRTMRQETMPAVIQMWKGVEKHIDRHTSADNTEMGGGTPWVFSPDRKFSLAPDTFLLHSRAPDLHWTSCARHLTASHQGPGFTLDFLRQTPDCFTSGPRIYTGLFQICLSTSAITCPFPLCSKERSSPVKGSQTSPQMFCP